MPDFTPIRGVLKHGDRRNDRVRKHPKYSRDNAQHQSYKDNQTHYKLDEQQRYDVSPCKFQGRQRRNFVSQKSFTDGFCCGAGNQWRNDEQAEKYTNQSYRTCNQRQYFACPAQKGCANSKNKDRHLNNGRQPDHEGEVLNVQTKRAVQNHSGRHGFQE